MKLFCPLWTGSGGLSGERRHHTWMFATAHSIPWQQTALDLWSSAPRLARTAADEDVQGPGTWQNAVFWPGAAA